MISLPSSVRIYLATATTDMRKGFDGLSALVRNWNEDLYSGHLFVFVSRRGDRIKILTWDTGGFVLYYKRLERGRFRVPKLVEGQIKMQLDAAELSMLLDGIDFSRVRRPKKWQPNVKKEPTGIDRDLRL